MTRTGIGHILSYMNQSPSATVEFVNRELAVEQASQAIELLNVSDASEKEAWFLLQAVANQVGPSSNVGVEGIEWVAPANGRAKGKYLLSATCVDGYLQTSTGAPDTLELAASDYYLTKVRATRERRITALGGMRPLRKRRDGTGAALVAAVSASAHGREWLGAVTERTGAATLLLMVRVADAYGRDGVYARATLKAHTNLMSFDNRIELIREFPTVEASRGKAMSIRNAQHRESTPTMSVAVSAHSRRTPEAKPNPAATSAAVPRRPIHPFRPAALPTALKRSLRAAYDRGCTLEDVKKEWRLIERQNQSQAVAA